MSEWATEPFDFTSDYDPDIPEVTTMRYSTLSDHGEVFEVPESMTTDKPLWIGITSLGMERDGDFGGWRERFAYSVATGPLDADVQVQGDDLRGPAIGGVSEAEIAATLMGFLSAYAEGDLTDSRDDGGELFLSYDGDVVATGETAEFIHANGERFGMASSELENEYIEYAEAEWNEALGLDVRRAVSTGKEDE